LTAEEVARKAMTIAADMCIYTNHEFLLETLESKTPAVADTSAEEETPVKAEKKSSKSKKKE